MARIWRERYDPQRHQDKMWDVPVNRPADFRLIPQWVYFVDVCSFTFEFHSLEQLETCLRYYSAKTHPSTRLPVYTGDYGGDHTETQRWFERLPLYLREEPKRLRVVKALTRALATFDGSSHRRSRNR